MNKLLHQSARGFSHHYKPRVAIVGGGTGGLAVCAQLLRGGAVRPREIVVMDGCRDHLYSGYATMVGAGFCGRDRDKHQMRMMSRPIVEVFPDGVTIVPSMAAKIDPERNSVVTASGDEVTYETLVVAPGMPHDFDSLAGARAALDDPLSCVGSIYDGVEGPWKVNRIRESIRGGVVIFSNAIPPAKCAGAPLKVCFLFEDYLKKLGLRDKTEIHFYSSTGSVFSVPEYAAKLAEMAHKRGIIVHYNHALKGMDKDRKLAFFNDTTTGARVEVKYDYMHFSSNFKAADYIKKSPLCDSHGLVTVDSKTLQHIKYKNIFSLGDGSNVPVSKTAASITVQAPVVVHNLVNVLNGKSPSAKYNGYSVCPVFTGDNRMLFTESLFGHPHHSYLTSNMRPKWLYYFLTRHFMPIFYWLLIPRGMWYGTRFILRPSFK